MAILATKCGKHHSHSLVKTYGVFKYAQNPESGQIPPTPDAHGHINTYTHTCTHTCTELKDQLVEK